VGAGSLFSSWAALKKNPSNMLPLKWNVEELKNKPINR
jgi:hypothetical protein